MIEAIPKRNSFQSDSVSNIYIESINKILIILTSITHSNYLTITFTQLQLAVSSMPLFLLPSSCMAYAESEEPSIFLAGMMVDNGEGLKELYRSPLIRCP